MSADAVKCYDVAVVGAGPAGCSAALALARSGHEVVLLEKAALPRYKTCGGGLLHRALKLLPPPVESAIERRFNSVALNFLGSDRNYVVERPQPMVHMAMRADLDYLLTRQATAAGARLVESCLIRHLEEQPGYVEIISEQEKFRAKFVIAADGVHSATAKAIGWPALPALAPALEYEIHLPPEDFARFSQVPRFDFNSIAAGYSWVFPKRTHLSVGILSTERVSHELHTKLMDYLHSIGIHRIEKIEKHGFLIPIAPRPGPLARNRVLLVGDAAGLVDPVMAEGISHAILSGQLAAIALSESRLDVSAAGRRYLELLEKQILGELRAGRFLARLLYHHPHVRDLAFRLNGQKLCEFVADVVMGARNYRDAVKNPASTLKLFGLWKPRSATRLKPRATSS